MSDEEEVESCGRSISAFPSLRPPGEATDLAHSELRNALLVDRVPAILNNVDSLCYRILRRSPVVLSCSLFLARAAAVPSQREDARLSRMRGRWGSTY